MDGGAAERPWRVAAAQTDDAMVTKNSEMQRSQRSDGASNNAAVAVGGDPTMGKSASVEDAPLAASTRCMDDVRERAFRGLTAAARPLLWRMLLGVVDCADPAAWEATLARKREQYHRWRREFQSYRISADQDQEPHESKPADKITAAYRQDVALMKEIDKDVARTQSELSFFAVGGIQQQWMLRILFVYAKLHPELGYMQGMNEILAPLVFAFGSDESDEWANATEPDAFYAFCEIMNPAKLLYGKSPSDLTKTGVDMQMARLAVLLRQHDALLWQHLNSIGLTPDFYSFRWYMALLAREFPLETTLRIWDALLADPKRFSFLHYVSLAILRSQRGTLLHEGFTGALKTLQALPAALDVERMLAQAHEMREQDRQKDRRRSSVVLQLPPAGTLL